MGKCHSHLSSMEREEISRAVALGCGVRSIARQLGRSASTVSRELQRNAKRPTHYRATVAEWARAATGTHCPPNAQTGGSLVAPLRRPAPGGGLVAAANCGTAATRLPSGRGKAHLPRNHLRGDLHRSARRAEAHADRLSAPAPQGASSALPQRAQTWRYSEPYADRRAPRRGRGPAYSGALGRRHSQGSRQRLCGWHACGAHHPLGAARPYAWARLAQCRAGLRPQVAQHSAAAAQIDDLRPRTRNGETRAIEQEAEAAGLLRRPAQSVATWNQRKHQWLASPVSAEERRSRCPDTIGTQRGCRAPEQSSATDAELDDAERGLGSSIEISQRCTWNLRAPGL